MRQTRGNIIMGQKMKTQINGSGSLWVMFITAGQVPGKTADSKTSILCHRWIPRLERARCQGYCESPKPGCSYRFPQLEPTWTGSQCPDMENSPMRNMPGERAQQARVCRFSAKAALEEFDVGKLMYSLIKYLWHSCDKQRNKRRQDMAPDIQL